jgi:hypothetical protein
VLIWPETLRVNGATGKGCVEFGGGAGITATGFAGSAGIVHAVAPNPPTEANAVFV